MVNRTALLATNVRHWGRFSLAFLLGVIAIGCFADKVRAQSDTSVPVIVQMELSPIYIDTSSQSQTITLTVHITDDLSGFQSALISFAPEFGGTQRAEVHFYTVQRISGTTTDGIYQNEITMPRYSAWGRWIIDYVHIGDAVGNHEDVSRCCSQYWPYPWYFINARDTEHMFLPLVVGYKSF